MRDIPQLPVVRVWEQFVDVDSARVRNFRDFVFEFDFVRNAVHEFERFPLLRRAEIDGLESVVAHYQTFYHSVVNVVSEFRDVRYVVDGVLYELPVFESLLVQSSGGERERVVHQERLVRVYRRAYESERYVALPVLDIRGAVAGVHHVVLD